MKKNIGIVFGGNSVEHEISIITALQAIENFDTKKYNCIPIYMSKSGKLYSEEKFKNIDEFKDLENLEKNFKEKLIYNENKKNFLISKKKSFFKGKDQIEIDLFFPIVHGTNVEDGKLQGFFETQNLPYIGPSTTSGVLGQDKGIMKDVLKAHNINQTKYVVINEEEKYEEIIQKVNNMLSYPVIIKPACLGSSIGISICESKEQLKTQLKNTFKYDSNIVIEEVLNDFEEMNISVREVNSKIITSVIEKVGTSNELLTYDDKYLAKGKTQSQGMASLQREIPAHIERQLIDKIEVLAKQVYKILRCESLIRIDMMIVGEDVYINEINSIPGSLAFYLWEESGTSYTNLLDQMVEEGIKKYYKNKNKTFNFKTNVLDNQGGKLKGK